MVRGMNASDIRVIGSAIIMNVTNITIDITPSNGAIWTNNYLVTISPSPSTSFINGGMVNGNISIMIPSILVSYNITSSNVTSTVMVASNIIDTASNRLSADIISPLVIFGNQHQQSHQSSKQATCPYLYIHCITVTYMICYLNADGMCICYDDMMWPMNE